MKRLLDILIASFLLLCCLPVLLPVILLVFLQDFRNPFYLGQRMGKGERPFTMVKLRSMRVNADRTGVDSTAADDQRITKIGSFIRAYKLDELMQLWNVLIGDMSLTGPRPNVERETQAYTCVEKNLLKVRPGITDLASIVFSDEGEILRGASDPDLLYNQIIRPWKSRLALIQVEASSLTLDLKVVWFTALSLLSKKRALDGVARILEDLGAPVDVRKVARRDAALPAAPPPGAAGVVSSRETVSA